MANVLVLGSGGMAGHVAALSLQAEGHEVRGLQRSPSVLDIDCIQGDVLNFDWLRGVLKAGRFDSIVNCTGILNRRAKSNPALTILTNAYLPHWLAQEARAFGTQLIQISTDCVFSGDHGYYSETSVPDARDLYGRSKMLGEVTEGALTLRTSIIGPELKASGTGLLNWLLMQEGQVSGYTESIWGGVTTIELARIIGWAIENRSITGLVHVTNGEQVSKRDLLRIVADEMALPLAISSASGTVTNKSLQASLSPGVPPIPSYRRMIRNMARWMSDYSQLYDHYRVLT